MEYQQLEALPDMAPESRVWIYQSDRPFTEAESVQIEQLLRTFASRWVSHNRALRAASGLLHNRFVVLAVDERQAGASGCSIDASVHFLKQLQAEFGVDLFDRMRFSYQTADGQVETLPRDAFATAYAEGQIGPETLVFDPLVKTKAELDQQFVKPLWESWHRQMV